MTESTNHTNVDKAEIARFEALAARWWDVAGDSGPLHQINPLRLGWIEERVSVAGQRILDVGCGGGILAESLAAKGAEVTGIDMGDAPLEVARLHLLESGLEVDYRKTTAEDLADEAPGQFDVVTCLEMLEHVPSPVRVVEACYTLVRPGGHVFFSTINRNAKSFMLAIVGAEYVLRMLPRGTHEYAKFIRPAELESWARGAGLELQGMTGMRYNPLTGSYSLGTDVDVNYLMHCTRPA